MIYFKIDDNGLEAFSLFLELQSKQDQAVQKARKLINDLGIKAQNFEYNGSGQCIGFPYHAEEPVPEGMRVIDGKLRPHRRTKTGKHISNRMKKIKLPTGSDLMRIMVGAVGQYVNGKKLKHGMGCRVEEDVVLMNCHPKVWENAQKKDGFEVPEGLIEITHLEYKELLNHQ